MACIPNAFDANAPFHRFKTSRTKRRRRVTNANRRHASTEENDDQDQRDQDDNDNNNRRRRRRRRNKDNNKSRHKSTRRQARQQRASRFQQNQAARSFDDQFKQFDRGGKRYKKGLQPSISELIAHVNHEHKKSRKKSNKSCLKATAIGLAREERVAKTSVQQQVDTLWKSGRYGHAPKEKPPDTVRVLFENFNSLGVFATGKEKSRKIRRLNQLLREYGADILAGYET